MNGQVSGAWVLCDQLCTVSWPPLLCVVWMGLRDDGDWGRAWRTPEEPLSLSGLSCISYTPSVCPLWRGKSGTLHLSCWEGGRRRTTCKWRWGDKEKVCVRREDQNGLSKHKLLLFSSSVFIPSSHHHPSLFPKFHFPSSCSLIACHRSLWGREVFDNSGMSAAQTFIITGKSRGSTRQLPENHSSTKTWCYLVTP